MKRPNSSAKRAARTASNEIVRLTIELTGEQFSDLSDWASECRTNPDELAAALAMEMIELKRNGAESSFEDEIATTIYALRKFVDNRKDRELSVSMKLNGDELDLVRSFLVSSLECDTTGPGTGDADTAIRRWKSQRSGYIDRARTIHPSSPRVEFERIREEHDAEAALLVRLNALRHTAAGAGNSSFGNSGDRHA